MAVYETLPDDILAKLRSADRVTVLTGAGVSAESGVPTFRGADGLWRNFRAEELATPEAFHRDPALVWEWYDMRRRRVAACRPNAGHEALAAMERRFADFTLVTQNVDGLHRLAGSTAPVALHGDIWFTRCPTEGRIVENREVPLSAIPPHCAECGRLVRPHIVWFGESLDPGVIETAFAAARRAEVFFVVGTSGVVYPAAGLAGFARRAGGIVIEINTEKTPLSAEADVTLLGPSGEILPAIVSAL
jgi:NAD-dependent deacetylase